MLTSFFTLLFSDSTPVATTLCLPLALRVIGPGPELGPGPETESGLGEGDSFCFFRAIPKVTGFEVWAE
jgi:hypothetical protein